MITNAQKIKYKYLSLCPPDCVAAPWRLPCSPICTHRPCSSTARLFCQGAVMHMLPLCAIKHMTPNHWCVRAAREREEGVKTHMLFWKDVGNRILLDRPLPFKSHQSYRPLLCFIPALQEIWSGPAKNSAVMTVMTSTPRSASHYRGEAVMRLSSQP